MKKIQMKIHTVLFDAETFGITGKSLKMLRNAIADNLHDEILVLEIPTEYILCGFLLLNRTKGTAVWSGDGFRTDKGGEGGRGYSAATRMMDIFGIRYLSLFSESSRNHFKNALAIQDEIEQAKTLLSASNKVADEFGEEEYNCVYEVTPWY